MKNIEKYEEHLDTALNRITALKNEDFDDVDLIIESIEFDKFKAKGIRLNLNVVLVIAVTFLLSITIYWLK